MVFHAYSLVFKTSDSAGMFLQAVLPLTTCTWGIPNTYLGSGYMLSCISPFQWPPPFLTITIKTETKMVKSLYNRLPSLSQ